MFEPLNHSIKFAVYCAVNLVNGKIYVGATSKGISARRSSHFCRASRGEDGVFVRAIRKYGRNSFEFVMLKVCRDWDDALESEREKIAELSPEYNATKGGGGVYGLRHSDESKAKMSAAKIGKPGLWARQPMPDEMRRKLGDLRRAEKGLRNITPDHKAKLLVNAAKANAARRRPVECLNDGMIFPSATEAARKHGVSTSQITHWCDGMVSRKGLKFRRVEAAA